MSSNLLSDNIVHSYLGITIEYSKKDKVTKFTIYDYLEDISAEMPADMKGTAPTLAMSYEKELDFFHQTPSQLLFAAKRGRPDLQVADFPRSTWTSNQILISVLKTRRILRGKVLENFLSIVSNILPPTTESINTLHTH
jgi:hypothetical protein